MDVEKKIRSEAKSGVIKHLEKKENHIAKLDEIESIISSFGVGKEGVRYILEELESQGVISIKNENEVMLVI